MSWKTRMGRETIISNEIEEYLLKQGFEYSTFYPRFSYTDSAYAQAKTVNERCLFLTHMDKKGDKLRIYVTGSEIYLEIEDVRGNFVSSNLVEVPSYLERVKDMDELLDTLVSQ